MLSVYLGDAQTFDILCHDADTGADVTPVSGYFNMYRVADETAVISGVAVTTISGHYVDYLLTSTANTVAGYMCYVFNIYFENGYAESFKNYCEIVEPRR